MTEPPRKIELSIEIDAPVAAVWKAITEARDIANWFSPEATVVGSGVGSTLTVSWGDGMAFSADIEAHFRRVMTPPDRR